MTPSLEGWPIANGDETSVEVDLKLCTVKPLHLTKLIKYLIFKTTEEKAIYN